MDRLGHPPCSLLPESSWESFDARTSGSSCPCHGTTGRIASQAGTGHDDPSATGGASTDRVVGGGRSFQRTQIAGKLVVTRPMVRKWRRRWSASQDQLRVVEGEESDSAVQSRICEILADAPRCGRPSDISPEQILEIILACEDPEAAQRPFSHWTPGEVARESVRRGIIESISTRSVDRFLKGDRS